MKLHEDESLFKELVAATAQKMRLPEVYIEKDYWVTRVLKNLSLSEHAGSVVFKGGTSLSKAYRIIDRFSEDVDLAIFGDGLNQNAIKKLLKGVETAAAEGMEYKSGDTRESKGSKFRKTVHQYPRVIDSSDFGQASPELLIEVNSFTNPEPFETIELQSYIADALQEAEQAEVIREHELEAFPIQVLSIRRTLIEKILGIIKDSYHDEPTQKLSNRIRHLYDVCLILRKDEYKEFIAHEDFRDICNKCVEDEKRLFTDTAHLFDNLLSKAPLFSNFDHWKASLTVTYTTSFKNLVYSDLPHMDEISETIVLLEKALKDQHM